MPWGAEVEEVMCVGYGGVDSYDFHALEVIQVWFFEMMNSDLK